ncbi:cytochrome-c peroxidase [Spirosoma aerophilum]
MPDKHVTTSYRFVCLFLLIITIPAFLPKPALPKDQPIYDRFIADNNRFNQQVQQLAHYVAIDAPDDSLRASFRRSRVAYKRIEWLLEYFQPFLATHINGPPVVEVEGTEPGQTPVLPSGLQVVEPFLFPTYERSGKAVLTHELTALLTYAARLEQSIPSGQITDADVLEATRQQLFRILTAGLTGYDAPEALTGLSEAAVSLHSLHEACVPYTRQLAQPQAAQIEQHWMDAIRTLEHADDFKQFDRVSFIRNQLYPLCRSVQHMRQTLDIEAGSSNRFLSPSAATLSDSGAFQSDYLINFGAFRSTPQKVLLGRILFFDPLLSGNNTRSCASCHQPERAFTDGLSKSQSLSGRKRVLRNAPTLINAGLQNAQFYDSRAIYLEDQAHDVLTNVSEMRTSGEEIVKKLSASIAYKKLFGEAFPAGLTAPNVRNALACYVRSLVGLNAPIDRYLRGESVAISTDEVQGLNLFLGKARCATCHFFPIYNGFVPPHYEKTESEIIGIPRRAKTHKARLDLDMGKFYTYQKDRHRFAFKTPTVRNVALTAPYMHNGVYKTLDEVVDFYDRGGGWGIGIQLDGQTLPKSPLHLSGSEKTALVTFLRSLSDTTGLTRQPQQLPAIEGNSALSRRKIGGSY